MKTKSGALATRLIHAGEPSPRIGGAVSMPVFQSATFEYPGDGGQELRYIRLNNTPNHQALNRKLADIEGAESALVTGSGMAAIAATLMTLLSGGDHLLLQGTVYGGTYGLVTTLLSDFGVSFDLIDAGDPASWRKKVRHNTRLIYVEGIGNPLMRIADLPAVTAFARRHFLTSVIDNTFLTPVNYLPLPAGFDLVVHSSTKYLNGHSDLVAGVVAGRSEQVARIGERLKYLGGTLDPHACYLLHRGLKTLELRVTRQNANALEIARFLAAHPAVAAVSYPGLPDHPEHERAREWFAGYGGMLSFRPAGGAKAGDRFMGRLKLVVVAPSLGGVETLVSRPAETSHVGLTARERQSLGISEDLIRLSVGIESAGDIIADLEQALS